MFFYIMLHNSRFLRFLTWLNSVIKKKRCSGLYFFPFHLRGVFGKKKATQNPNDDVLLVFRGGGGSRERESEVAIGPEMLVPPWMQLRLCFQW